MICIMFYLFNQGNVGLIFTKGDLKEVSEEVAKYKVKLPFRNCSILCLVCYMQCYGTVALYLLLRLVLLL